jgi:hypothetical protein
MIAEERVDPLAQRHQRLADRPSLLVYRSGVTVPRPEVPSSARMSDRSCTA